MKNLKEIDSIEDVREHLKIAIKLEHATIPPYMTALYSIIPEKNEAAIKVLQVILREEMLHLTNAANILNAIDGTPDLSVSGFVPRYPACLPDGEDDFEVSLQAFSKDAIETFLNIERPKKPSDAPAGSQIQSFADGQIFMIKRTVDDKRILPPVEMKNGDVMHFYSIGEFYKAIELGLELLCEKLSAEKVFTGDFTKQVGPEHFWGGGGQITKVNNLMTAKKAIELIIVEGEGDNYSIYEDPKSEELSHYYRFQQLKLGKYYKKHDVPGVPSGPKIDVDFTLDGVYKIKTNCRLQDCEGNEELEENILKFNQFYKKLLFNLTTAFNGQPNLLEPAIYDMTTIRNLIGEIMGNPLPNQSKLMAAPTFEIW